MAVSQDYFTYNTGADIVPEGHFKISPSRLSRFFDDTSAWYRECLLGEEPAFQGNTASFLGTVVHGLAAMYIQERSVDYVAAEIFIDSITNPEVDKVYIRQQYVPMFEALVSQYLNELVKDPSLRSELFMYGNVLNNVGVGGSLDCLTSRRVHDFKTTTALNAPTSIKREYFFQQMCYVWLARKHGIMVDSFELVYITSNEVGRVSEKTGKPLQDYPTTISRIVHQVTGEDLLFIESVIKLCAESVDKWNTDPSIRYLLAQDYRLKQQAAPILFN